MCLFFIIFHDKKKIPRKWAFYKKYESYFSCPAQGWGNQAHLQGPIAPALFPVLCSVFCVASVALCLRLTMLHCLHAPEADVCQGLGACVCCCRLPCEIEL